MLASGIITRLPRIAVALVVASAFVLASIGAAEPAQATTVEITRDSSPAASVGNSSGGTAFSLISCPAGYIATGIRGTQGSADWAIQVALVCQLMDVANSRLSTTAYTAQSHGGTPTNTNLCPAGQVLVGLSMRSNTVLGYHVLTEAKPKCQTLTFGTPSAPAVPTLTGSVGTQDLSFGAANSGNYLAEANCPTGKFIVGFSGRAGSGLDQFNPYCGRISSSAPTISTAATISVATPAAGQSLTVTSAFGGSPAPSTTTQWYRCTSPGTATTSVPGDCTAITGATGSTYTPTGDDLNFYIRGATTATNAFGSATTVSAASGPVYVPAPVPDLAAASDSGSSATDNRTNVTSPIISLTSLLAPAGGNASDVTVTATDGVTTVTCTPFTATGTTGQCQLPTLTEGTWTVTAQQTFNGVSSAVSTPLPVVVDTTAPAINALAITAAGSSVADGGTTNATSIALTSPTSSDASSVTYQCQLDSGSWATCPASYTGLTSGSHTVTVRATDAAGNVSTRAHAFTVIDKPAVALATASDTGSSTSDNVTRDSTPTIALSGLAVVSGATVTVTATKGGVTETCGPLTIVSATDSCTFGATLADGSWSISATQTYGGVTSPLATATTVVVDTTPASIAAITLRNGSTSATPIADGAGTAAGTTNTFYLATPTATDANPGTVLTCAIDGRAPTTCPSSYTNLAPGQHTLVVTATDKAGNVSTLTKTWSVVTPPVIDLDPLSDSGYLNSDNNTSDATPTYKLSGLIPGATVTLTATRSGGGTETCTIIAAAATDVCTFPAIVDGTWTIKATQTYPASGSATSSVSNTETLVVDTVAPAFNRFSASSSGLSSIADGATVTGSLGWDYTLYGIFTDAESNEQGGTCSVDGGALQSLTATVENCSLMDATSGIHQVTFTRFDKAGNQAAPRTFTWTVVNAPTLALAASSDTGSSSTDRLTADSTPTMTVGDLAPGAVVTVTATKSGMTSVTCTFTAPAATAPATASTGGCDLGALADGAWTITASQSLGGVTRPSSSTTVTIDTVRPTMTAPTITAAGTALPNDGATTATSVVIGAVTRPTGVTTVCKLDGVVVTCPTANTTFPGLSVGIHTFEVIGTDAAGNVGVSTKAWRVVGQPTVALDSGSDTGSSTADRITRDDTPRINVGNLGEGGTVTVTATRAGSTAVSCTFIPTGPTGACDLPGLVDGTWSVTATQSYPSGGGTVTSLAATPVSVTVDTVAPDLPTVAMAGGLLNGGVISSGAVTFSAPPSSGSPTPAGTIVECSLNGAAFAACPAGYSGLADGAYTLTTRATDVAGNTSSTNFQWFQVTTPVVLPDPSANLGTNGIPTSNASVQNISLSSLTDGASVTITATQGGESVSCTFTASGSTGGCALDFTGKSDGTWTITATQTVGGTTSSAAVPYDIVIDRAAPSLTAVLADPRTTPSTAVAGTGISTGGMTGSTTLVLATTATDVIDPSVTVTCAFDGGASTSCPAQYSGLGYGEHTLVVTAVDDAGNRQVSTTTFFVTAPPTVSLDPRSDSGASGDGITNDNTPFIAVTDLGDNVDVVVTATKGGQSFSCFLLNVSGSGSCELSSLVDGSWTVTATQARHGHPSSISAASAPATVQIDTVAPRALLATFAAGGASLTSGGGTTATSLSMTGPTATDANALTYACALDGGAAGPCGSLTGLTAGTHSLVYTATDAAGNQASSTLSWTVLAPPVVALSSASDTGASNSDGITREQSPSIAVSELIPGASVTVTATFPGQDPVTCTFIAPAAVGGAPSSTGSCPLPTLPADGVWSISAVQSIGTGQSGPSATRSFTLDTAAPVVADITGAAGGGAIPNGSGTDQTSIALALPSLAAGESMTCALDGVARPCADPISGLSSGQHSFTATITDLAGNATTTSFVWAVLGTPTASLPASSDSGASAADRITNDITPQITAGNLAALARVTVTATRVGASGVVATCDFVVSEGVVSCDLPELADGDWDVTVVQSIGAASSNPSAALRITIDATAPDEPSMAISGAGSTLAFVDGSTTVTTADALSFTAGPSSSDAIDGSPTITCALNGATPTSCPPAIFTALPSGVHTLSVTSTDDAGNASTAVHTWTSLGTPTILIAAGSDTGTAGDGLTSERRPAFTVGNLLPGAVVTVTATSGAATRTCTFTAPAAVSPSTSSIASCTLDADIDGGPWSVTATQSSGGATSAGAAPTAVTVIQPQPITLSAPATVSLADAVVTVVARSQPLPGNPVVLVSQTPAVCIVVSGVVTLVGPGQCTLRGTAASDTSTGTHYEVGSDEVTFTVAGIPVPVTTPAIVVGGGSSATFTSTFTTASPAQSGGQSPSRPETAGSGGQDGAGSTVGLLPPPPPLRTDVQRLPDGRRAQVTVVVRQDEPGAPVRSVVLVVFDERGNAIARIPVDVPQGETTVIATVPFRNPGYQVRAYTTNEAGVSKRAPIGANMLQRPTTLGRRPDGTPILFGKEIARPVLFGPDSPALDARSRAILDGVVRYAARNGGRVFITGFVRNGGGSARDQKALSNARAKQVATYLSRRGVDTWIRYNGYGAYRAGAGQPRDRRVEVRWSDAEVPGLRSLPVNAPLGGLDLGS